ncbi:class IV adenylate cyclase [Photobacterium sp.]|uniref:class IV adenylate cyclase n=1 Tax=Photobacterium sp. TaxID=660 RepID=UPI00299CFDE3|nr:class IV adenylate cyclase [Photobacterium sp.]MDX1303551.1 class IV adenylate cyclase [Photobacterium sp.]
MSQHFEGKFEVELKYRLNSRERFLFKLHQMSPEVMLENNIEHDCYFDSPKHLLSNESKSICIREMQPSGIMLWIVKGPEKARCEAVNITDAVKAKSMLRTMGFEPVLEMRKKRSIYFLGNYHVTVDHLENIGDFAELAIMTDDASMLEEYKQQLLALAQNLGLTDNQLEQKSYRELYMMQ